MWVRNYNDCFSQSRCVDKTIEANNLDIVVIDEIYENLLIDQKEYSKAYRQKNFDKLRK